MATDPNVLAVMVNPHNSGEYVAYSLAGNWVRGIGTGQQLSELQSRGVPTSTLSTDLFDALPQLAAY